MGIFFDQDWFDDRLAAAGLTRAAMAQAAGMTIDEVEMVFSDRRELEGPEVRAIARMLSADPSEVAMRSGAADRGRTGGGAGDALAGTRDGRAARVRGDARGDRGLARTARPAGAAGGAGDPEAGPAVGVQQTPKASAFAALRRDAPLRTWLCSEAGVIRLLCCRLGPHLEGPGTRDAPRDVASLFPALPADRRVRGSRVPGRCWSAASINGVFQPLVRVRRRRAGRGVQPGPRNIPALHTMAGHPLGMATDTSRPVPGRAGFSRSPASTPRC